MDNEKIGWMKLKCIKEIVNDEYYDEKLTGYSLGAEDYSEGETFIIDSTMGDKYLKDYPSCFEEVKMEKSDWIKLAEERIEYAKYALRGRENNDYFDTQRKKIQHAKDLILTGLSNTNDLFELILTIYDMPKEKCTYWYDTPQETPYSIIKQIEELSENDSSILTPNKAVKNALQNGISTDNVKEAIKVELSKQNLENTKEGEKVDD